MWRKDSDETPFTGTAIIPGYGFGDRVLEDVDFSGEFVDGELVEDSVKCLDRGGYWKTLNTDYWLKKAIKFVHGHDELDSVDGESIYNADLVESHVEALKNDPNVIYDEETNSFTVTESAPGPNTAPSAREIIKNYMYHDK